MAGGNADRFGSVICGVLGVAPGDITDELSPDTVESWDSLNHINLIGALEQEFGVTLAAQDLGAFQSVSKLKALLAEHGVTI